MRSVYGGSTYYVIPREWFRRWKTEYIDEYGFLLSNLLAYSVRNKFS